MRCKNIPLLEQLFLKKPSSSSLHVLNYSKVIIVYRFIINRANFGIYEPLFRVLVSKMPLQTEIKQFTIIVFIGCKSLFHTKSGAHKIYECSRFN